MKNILLYNSGGGLGDSIQLIPLILSLKITLEDQIYIILELTLITLWANLRSIM